MVAMNTWPTDAADGSVANEARWRKMARAFAPSGVILDAGTEMVPTLAFPNLTVKAGACWVDGHYCELTSNQVLTVTAAGLAVVRFDPVANTAELLYRDGVSTPAQSPTGTFELPIAQITASALVDVRCLLPPFGGPPIFPTTAARSMNTAGIVEDGQLALAQDTGTLSQYVGAQGAWRAGPWSAPRGLVAPGVTTVANFTFTTTVGGSPFSAYNLSKNRVYELHVVGDVLNGTVTGVIDTMFGAKTSGTPLTQQVKFTQTTANGENTFHAVGIYLPTVDESFGFKAYAISTAGTTQTVTSISMWIIDLGPNGNP